MAMVMLAVGLAAPLGAASLLEPDQRGYGTHQQLGLPPCTFVVLFGRRCPTCGGTTSWAYLVRGRLIEAAQANLGGALLGTLDVIAVPWQLLSALRGRWLGRAPTSTVVAWVATVMFAVMMIEWGVRLIAG